MFDNERGGLTCDSVTRPDFLPVLSGWWLRIFVDVFVADLKVEGVLLAVCRQRRQQHEAGDREQHFGTAEMATMFLILYDSGTHFADLVLFIEVSKLAFESGVYHWCI